MLALMDLPNRDDLIREIKAAAGSTSPEQIEEQIRQAVDQERMKSRTELEIQKIKQQEAAKFLSQKYFLLRKMTLWKIHLKNIID